ncbi:MAG: elongation factor P [Patescibacteria group bacterium]|nr:elongation factor P [Patescibacteria group bacterium]
MLSISDIRIGTVIEVNGQPWKATKAEHHVMGRGGAVLRVTLKNLITGAVVSKTMQGNEKVEEANVARSKAQFMYHDGASAYFMDQNTFEQFAFNVSDLGDQARYLVEGADVDVQLFNNVPVVIDLPPNMTFEVVEAPEGARGDTANNPTKTIKVQTGYELQAPLFIKKGEKVKIDTRTGLYLERVNR